MSKQWQDKTRCGHEYRITTRDPDSGKPTIGEITDDGLIIRVKWFGNGKCNLDGEHPYDLIPIEPEAPSPAKVRVDLALAAHSLKAAVVEYQRAEDAKDKAGEASFNAFVASGKTEVVVKIDGAYYYFWTRETRTFFREIEVL
jgi:hypothetical protein